MGIRTFIALAAAGMSCALASAQNPPLIRILNEELRRNFEVLRKGDSAPYFISYEVFETQTDVVTASFGAVLNQSRSHARSADVSVRVGSPALDNYHRIGGERGSQVASTILPLEDNAAPIRRRLWLATDAAYREAVQQYLRVQSSQQTRVAAEDNSDDHSKEEPSQFTAKVAALKPIPADWTERIRRLSAVFSRYPTVLQGNVALMVSREVKDFVNTEGTAIQQGRTWAQVVITAQGKAGDGMDLATSETFEADEAGHLPKEDVIRAAVEKSAKDLSDLMRAPVVDPFTGPAILSGRAAGVFFHEIFGHRIEGHRQKDESEGQTFTKRIDEPVLPDFLSVIFDPTRQKSGPVYLNGAYDYDDEGIRARPVTLVDKGVLKTFLMSRSPVRRFPKSNGHGRKQAGADVVSRQSNLIVESSRTVPEAQLREMLREEIRKQGKPYGLYFSRVTGGYTMTARRGLQAFTVIPLVVYKVYPDNQPDELVRGVDIVGTPLQSFERILATGDQAEVFNGICGAESGNVPVSAVAPAILISNLEVQRKQRALDRPPYLPPPGEGR